MHANAVAAIEREARELVACFQSDTDEKAVKEWSPQLHASAHIQECDIDGILRIATFDGRSMAEIKLQVGDKNKAFVLDGPSCQRLCALSVKLADHADFGYSVTSRSMRNHVEKWLTQVLWEEGGAEKPLIDFLHENIAAQIKEYEIWIPLLDLELEEDLQLGPFHLKSVQETDIDRIRRSLSEFAISEGASAVDADAYALRLAKMAMGRAAVVSRSNSDLSRAQERALVAAEKVSALLRCLQPINMCCETRSYLAPVGQDGLEGIAALAFADGKIVCDTARLASPPPFALRLTKKRISRPWEAALLASVGQLLEAAPMSAFQELLLKALLVYANSATARSPGEKLVFTFAALETLLLINEGEPIQHNLGRRIGYLIADSLEARKDVIALIKAAYRLRSRFMHHGERPTPAQHLTLNQVLSITYEVFMLALQSQKSLESVANFGEWIDDRMLESASVVSRESGVVSIPDLPETRSSITFTVRLRGHKDAQRLP